MNELDILVNVDLETRTVKEEKKRLKIIRIGTSGSIRREISIGSHVVSINAIGMDSLASFYNLSQSSLESDICASFQALTKIKCQPYFTQGSTGLIETFGNGMYQGNTLTCPGFYASQGRELRVKPVIQSFIEKISDFQNYGFILTNLEMETAGYYAMGKILEHETLSLNVILGNRIDNTFAKKPKSMVDGLIELTLSRL